MACFLLRMFHKHSHISTRPTQLASIPFTIRSKIAYSNQWLRNASSHSPELQKKGGEIQLICGPMFAGKTTELLRRARRYIEAQYKCLWIKSVVDGRYCTKMITTHDGDRVEARSVKKLSEAIDWIHEYDCIAIDEGHFFSDLEDFTERVANEGKIVVVAALDADFRRKPFTQVISLVPLAERVTKLTSICIECYSEASFTRRITNDQQITLVGGKELYQPVCRACFFKHA